MTVLHCCVTLALQLLAEQPLTASHRRQAVLGFLQAKLEADDEQPQLEGARVSRAQDSCGAALLLGCLACM